MRNSLPLLLVFAVLLGGAAWLFFGGSAMAPQSVLLAGVSADLDLNQKGQKLDIALAAKPSLVDGGESRVMEIPKSKGSLVQELSEAATMASGPKARGRAVDVRGDPISGALVVVAGMDPFLIDFAGNSNTGFGGRWRTTTDDDGRFVLHGPEPGGLRLGLWSAGFAPLKIQNLVLPAGDGADFGDLVLESGVVLEGRVIVPGGTPVPGASLYVISTMASRDPLSAVTSMASRVPIATSDNEGRFRIDSASAGPWKLLVKSDGQPNKFFEGRTEQPGEVRSGLELELSLGASISGRVIGIPEDNEEQLYVRATWKPAEGNYGTARNSREGDIDDDGLFVIEGCHQNARYELQVRVKDDEPKSQWGANAKRRSEIRVAQGGQAGIEIAWMGSLGVLFQVLGAAGEPLENFKVRYGTRLTLVKDDQGEFQNLFPGGWVRLENLRSTLLSRPLSIQIEAPGFQSFNHKIDLRAGQVIDAGRFTLKVATLLTTTVLDAATGQPLVNASVSLSINTEADDPSLFAVEAVVDQSSATGAKIKRRISQTNSEGIARLTSFEGMTGQLVVTEDDHAPLVLASVAMPRGESTELEVSLGFGGSVVVTVLDSFGNPKPGAKVEIRKASIATSHANEFSLEEFFSNRDEGVTDQDGVVLYEHLRPGQHEFRINQFSMANGMLVFLEEANPGDQGWTSVTVSEGSHSEIELREEPQAFLDGVVREDGELLAGATLSLTPKVEQDPLNLSVISVLGSTVGSGTGSTDGRGVFSIEGVKPGSYSLTVDHVTRAMGQQFDVELIEGQNRMDVELSVAVVEGRITDGDGQPLAGVQVEIESKEQPNDYRLVVFADPISDETEQVGDIPLDTSKTDADGRYRFSGVAIGERLSISASPKGRIPARSSLFSVAAGQVKSGIDLVLSAAGRVVVTVNFSRDGERASVRGKYLDADGVESAIGFIFKENVSLDGLKPGRWEITVKLFGSGVPEGQFKSQIVTVSLGKTTELEVTF